MSGQHELDLSELDKNIRSLINMMDNKFKDQAMTIRALKDQQGQLESQQEKQGDTIEDQIIALEKVAASVVANNNNNTRIDLKQNQHSPPVVENHYVERFASMASAEESDQVYEQVEEQVFVPPVVRKVAPQLKSESTNKPKRGVPVTSGGTTKKLQFGDNKIEEDNNQYDSPIEEPSDEEEE